MLTLTNMQSLEKSTCVAVCLYTIHAMHGFVCNYVCKCIGYAIVLYFSGFIVCLAQQSAYL